MANAPTDDSPNEYKIYTDNSARHDAKKEIAMHNGAVL